MFGIRFATICTCLGLTASAIYGGDLYQASDATPVPEPQGSVEGNSYVNSSQSASTVYGPEVQDGGYGASEGNIFKRTWSRMRARCNGPLRAPFQVYNHNPGDLQIRPICPPYCDPTWGYHEPCWRAFPPVASCPPSGAVVSRSTKSADRSSQSTVTSKPATSPRSIASRAP